ncbi:VanW family protein [Nocardia sp. NPDC049707]|uniref:VanW family protein n=1 Tax=Nocardia sp. NPDC049707 TaxID=3154735 RepID=UPI00344AC724
MEQPRSAQQPGAHQAAAQHQSGPQSAAWAGDSAPTQPLRTSPRPTVPDPTDKRRQGRSAPEQPSGPSGLRSPIAQRIGVGVGALIVACGLAYVADLILSSGQVPRGVVVAGIDIGGKDTAAATAELRAAVDPRVDQELPLQIGDVQTRLTPKTAGLSADWDATFARVGGQPLNPITRLTSLFITHTVPVVSTIDERALDAQLTALRVHDRATVEGTIAFDGARPVAVPPVPGRILDGPAARTVLIENWYLGALLDLPETAAPIAVRAEAVEHALHTIAEPAVSAPIVFAGKNNATGRLEPEQIASIIFFAPDGQGGLAAAFKHEAALGVLGPQLAPSEVEAKDATFAVTGSTPTVVPAVVGDKINWAKTLEQLPNLIVAAQERTAQAIYEKVDPKLTTEAANALGVTEVMGQFTTSGFSGPSGVNIRVVARKVNGAIVKPGETFSLNDFTGPRGTAEGYVESGIIDHGRPSTAVGGGISQFATTLYNAAYFAGMEDAGHTEHSYYISRYPAAREATVFDGAIDLKFRNNSQSGVYIETSTTDSEVTVRLWGTKIVNVESITGEKTKPTEPTEIKLPKGKECIATEGAPGFTISDTRVITDRKTSREISRSTRTVKYDAVPVVKCE